MPSKPTDRYIREVDNETGVVTIKKRDTNEIIREFTQPITEVNDVVDELGPIKVHPDNIVKVKVHGKWVWVQKGMNLDKLPKLVWPYSEWFRDNICNLLTQGMTLTQIARIEGFPPVYVMNNWYRTQPDYKEQTQLAREAFGDYCHDQVVEIAQGTKKKSDVPVSKLQIQAMQWAAERGNAARYGKSLSVKGDPEKPIQIVVDTGIRRALPEAPKQVEAEVVREAKDVAGNDS
jgi:hypothetical protein